MHTVRHGFCTLLAAIALCAAHPAAADEGGGRFKIGYVYIDQEGNLSVNQESFNIDDPLAISLEDFKYFMDNGVMFNADLRRISLNNRNLAVSSSKADLFSVSLRDNRYRRVYDSAETYFTERESAGGTMTISPSRYLKLFGGFDYTDKHGDDLVVFEQPSDAAVVRSDYTNQSYSIGAQGFYKQSSLRLEYRASEFDDRVNKPSDRDANVFRASATAAIPGFERAVLSGGYDYRLDKLYAYRSELKTNQGWAATRIHLPLQFSADYRFVFARTLHEGNGIETDNVLNTVAVGKTWNRRGGLRIGYENRIADDLADRSESNGFLFNGWYSHANRVFLRALASTRDKDIVTGSTLIGDEDYIRYRVSVTADGGMLGDVSVQYQGRRKENKDIGSTVDYRSISTTWRLDTKKLGSLAVTYAYYLGEYENRSTNFEFSDNMVTGTITPAPYRGVGVRAGGTYYRSRRDLDIEKIALNLGATYSFRNGYYFDADYTAYNYDDFLAIDRFYTGNILEVSLARDFSL
ncbi:MAG: hypothetical protein HY770_06560 [Chitinivibrionia bacterium]|nr:hypothetical protein [Chitinivibrionia bacterium]